MLFPICMANIMGTYLLRPIINDYILPGDIPGLIWALIGMGLMYGVGVLATWGYNQLMVRTSQRVVSEIRSDLFHRTRDAIEAHLTVVFAALAVARHLQDVTGMSIKKIVTTLRPLRTVTVAIGDHEMLVEPTIPDAARAVIDAINAG